MNNEQQPNPQPAGGPVKNATERLREEVKTLLADSGPKVRGMVLDKLKAEEIDKRFQAVLGLLEKVRNKTQELRKAESSGAVQFALNGDRIGEPSFSKQQLEEMKKLRDYVEKLERALEKAFESSDFKQVLELAQSKE